MLKAILALPFNAAITIPAVILWLTWPAAPAPILSFRSTAAALLLALGLALFISTVRLFANVGKGSLAPWAPPKNLVVEGPYRYVRHPMITGVAATLAAQALFLGSWPTAAWFAAFVAINALYLPLKEEPDLIARFGEDYRDYMRHVPRWIPRLTPWSPRADTHSH